MRKRRIRKLLGAVCICVGVLAGCNNNENKIDQKTETDEEEINETIENNIEEKEASSLKGFSTPHTIMEAKDGYFIVKMESGLCQLLDMNGNEIIPFVEIATMSFPQSEDAEAVIIVNGKKAGLMDYSGNEILPLEYDFIRNWGYNSEYYLVQKDGIQSIVGMDGTLVKELSGTYAGLIGDSFLIDGDILTAQESIIPQGNVYSLDEKIIQADVNDFYDIDNIDPSGNAITDYFLNGYYFYYNTADATKNIVNSEGSNVLTFPTYKNKSRDLYNNFISIDCGNLLKIEYFPEGRSFGSTASYKLVNPDRKTVSEQYYRQVVKADDNTIYAIREDTDAVDVYDQNGEYIDILEIDTVFMAVGENNPLIAVYTPSPHFLNAEGKELQYEEYINISPLDSYWVIVNKSEEFALMDSSGEIRIPYGELNGTKSTTWTDVEIETYNGEEIDEIYTFDDVFCIVTTNDDESNVYLF